MTEKLTRRTLVWRGAVVGAIAPVAACLGATGAWAQTAALDPNDPTAKALGYVTASTTPNQMCSGCTLYQGKAGDAQGGCAIFPGKNVSAKGWCKSWAKKA